MFWLKQFFSGAGSHRRAFDEVFVVSVVAIFPLVLLPFIAALKASADTPFDLYKTLWSAVSSGQLYLYSFSTFGAIMWLCVEDFDKAFPPRKYFMLSAVLCGFLCLLVYSIDPTLSRPLNQVLVTTSLAIYAVFLVMYYALLVFKGQRAPDLATSLNNGADKLMAQSRSGRGAL